MKKSPINKMIEREMLFGVPPDELAIVTSNHESFTVYKSAKRGQSSFRITEALLDSLILISEKINKQPKLIISIGVDSAEYILTCDVTKK